MAQVVQRVLVLGKQRWNMVDEHTGELRQGTTIRYIENFDSVIEQNFEGVRVAKVTLDEKLFSEMVACPAWYQVTFDFTVKGDKPSLKAVGVEFIEPFQLAKK